MQNETSVGVGSLETKKRRMKKTIAGPEYDINLLDRKNENDIEMGKLKWCLMSVQHSKCLI